MTSWMEPAPEPVGWTGLSKAVKGAPQVAVSRATRRQGRAGKRASDALPPAPPHLALAAQDILLAQVTP